MEKLRAVFFGSGAFGLPVLDCLVASDAEILGVVTQPDKPSGRDLRTSPTPVKAKASELGLRTWEYSKPTAEAILRDLRPLNPHLFIVVSFGHLLKRDYLEMPSIAPVNIHASLLPRHRGASCIQEAILTGDTETGVTIMRMSEGLDEGDILLQKRTVIGPEETRSELESRLSSLAGEILSEALPLLAGVPVWVPQNGSLATVCRKIRKDDARLDFTKSAERLAREVRAYEGWPGSYLFIGGRRIRVHKAAAVAMSAQAAPGTVLESTDRLVIAAAGGSLEIRELQAEGRSRMRSADFLRGTRIDALSRVD